MKHSPKLTAEVVRLFSMRGKGVRIAIAGASMEPSLRAGMVVDVEPLAARPRIGDILVFRSERALVAHRLTGVELRPRSERRTARSERRFDAQIERYVTSGDAYPERLESVPPQSVVGRVSAVWKNAEPGALRVDGPQFERLGVLLARTRGLRALPAKLRKYRARFATMLLAGHRATVLPKPVFSTLVAATHAFERRDFARGVTLLECLGRSDLHETARRHHLSGCLSKWLDESAEAGVRVPPDLAEAFRRMRYANALQTGRVLACLHDVRDVFRVAGIAHVFIKGAGRLAARDPGADVQFSADVDVMVPAEAAELARAALRAAGYASVPGAYRRAQHDRWHHHCEALVSPAVAVPVEVHFALAAPKLARGLDYAALRTFARWVTSGGAQAKVLDDLGSAIVLAYHARDLHVWRDIVLLSRLLRSFDATTRRRFDTYMHAERTDGVRLASAVAAADAIIIGGGEWPRATARYLAWAALREDLPRPLYCDLVESIIGRCPMPKLHLHPPATPATWLRCWTRNLISLPSIARFARSRRLA